MNDQPTTNDDLPEDPKEPQDGHDELEDDLEELQYHPEVGTQKNVIVLHLFYLI